MKRGWKMLPLLFLCTLAFILFTTPATANVIQIADKTVTSAATLISSNSFRAALSCTNQSSTVHVRWGNSAVTATAGQRIQAGASIEIVDRSPIYMISEGADVTVSCTEENK